MMLSRLVTGTVAVMVSSALAAAGQLAPPGGPVGPTMKDLVEVEPRIAINANNTPGGADSVFAIAERGSYYLTGNVIGEAGKHGIRIAASDVTIDLGGFSLVGGPGTLSGIYMVGPSDRVTIRNGFVLLWGDRGILLDIGRAWLIESVHVSGCATDGIGSAANATTLRNCTFTLNGNRGIAIGAGSIEGCSAWLNGFHGISAGPATIRGCVSKDNQGRGIRAVGVVVNCYSRGNTLEGIHCGDGSIVIGSQVERNDLDGIEVTGRGSLILDCTAIGNVRHGIHASGSGGIVRSSLASQNGEDGIHVSGARFDVTDSTCLANGTINTVSGAGLRVMQGNCRIRANHIVSNPQGLVVAGAGNLIVRNSAADNVLDYTIVTGNAFGPIVNVAGVGDISGTPNANHPWANFEY